MEDNKDLKFLRMVYAIIGVIMLLVMQIVPYESPQLRLRLTLIVAAVIFGVGFNSTRKLKKALRVKKKDEEEVIDKEGSDEEA
ncbi:MAG: DUF4018 domain-containing protein [Tissierellia bacterium]|nr:DUF4018 domain-containing protein [Tissierellia bacterium]